MAGENIQYHTEDDVTIKVQAKVAAKPKIKRKGDEA